MKFKLSILLVACMLVFGCSQEPSGRADSTNNYSIRVIENCEYVEVVNGMSPFNNFSYTLAHKGNCKNPIHKYNTITK